MGHVQTSKVIAARRQDVYAFLADLQNVPEQLGGKIGVEFPSTPPALRSQAEFEVLMSRFHLTVRVVARVEQVQAPGRISYRQISGLFKEWTHLILLEEHGPEETLLTDIVDFVLPGGILGWLADDLFARAEVASVLDFRLEKIAEHFERENSHLNLRSDGESSS